ncbi:MAG: HEPN domain-containing protein [Pseudoxanthomonas suwonensis]|nr:HEPN domain-containing protein [Pseudoxanthomonas suwonensis]
MEIGTAYALKQRHRQLRDGHPEALRVRMHRAISWLDRAEHAADDLDARFIFLWIAFNAAYASEFGFEQTARSQVRAFVERLVKLDDGRLHHVLFEQFPGPVRTLLDNRFVFEPFWRALREHDPSERWKAQFDHERRLALRAVMEHGTASLLATVLDRLHVLRNQLVHGGATWNSGANRRQIKDAVAILGTVLPVMLQLMMDHPDEPFGEIAYPVLPG